MSDKISQSELANQCRHPKRKPVDSSQYEGEKGAGGKCVICGHVL